VTNSKKEKELGMAWYNFLVYFGLFAGSIINLIYGFVYITGGIYEVQSNGDITADIVYEYYGKILQSIDVVYGLSLFALAVIGLIVRQKLRHFQPDTIRFITVFYAFGFGAGIIYSCLVLLISGTAIGVGQIGTWIVYLIVLIANIKYFNNRAHLFISSNDLHSQEENTLKKSSLAYSTNNCEGEHFETPIFQENKYIQTDAETKNPDENIKILFCRKCGTRLFSDGVFCHNCGTKVR
jgi:hypothetical protein